MSEINPYASPALEQCAPQSEDRGNCGMCLLIVWSIESVIKLCLATAVLTDIDRLLESIAESVRSDAPYYYWPLFLLAFFVFETIGPIVGVVLLFKKQNRVDIYTTFWKVLKITGLLTLLTLAFLIGCAELLR